MSGSRDQDAHGGTISHASSSSRVGSSPRAPSYAQPTTAQLLPEYANAEAEAIRASFTTGNYRLLAHLPSDLKAHHISEATANRIDDNITSSYFVAPHGTYRKFGSKDALFSTFDYAPEEYSLASKLQTMVRKDAEQRRLAVNPLPFLYSTPRPQLINGLAGQPTPEENERYAGQDVYSTAEEQARRMQYLDAQSILYGPFVPTSGARTIGDDKIIRRKLPDIVSKLMRELDADWGDASFQIYCDPEDLVIVQFDQATVDNPKGLLAYMNMFVKTNKVVSEYALSKLVELWNHTTGADGMLYFAFRPPWVRRRAADSMYVLHPEMAVPGGKFIDEQRERRKELREGEKHQLQQEEMLRLTAASSSGQNTARSTTMNDQQQPQSQPQSKYPQPSSSSAAASASSAYPASLAGGVHPALPPPSSSSSSSATGARTASGSHQAHLQAAAAAAALSPEDRDQMARLMESFDAGLNVRRAS